MPNAEYAFPKFTRCPDCGKKGVSLRLRADEDHYGCRYCPFFFFTEGTDPRDVTNQARWNMANERGPTWTVPIGDLHLLIEMVESLPVALSTVMTDAQAAAYERLRSTVRAHIDSSEGRP